jgi:Ca2+-binding RTX toxin-like protein
MRTLHTRGWHPIPWLLIIALFMTGLASPVYAQGSASDRTATPACGGHPATIVGTPGDDETLVGTIGDDVIMGLGGDDVIHALAGDDLICGGPGNDLERGGRGSDGLAGDKGNDILSCSLGFDDGGLSGGGGDDTLYGGSLCSNALHPGMGDDLIIGRGDEENAVFFEDARRPIHADLSTGIAVGQGTDTLVRIDGLYGGPFDDTLIGSDGRDDLVGEGGDDTLVGRGGDDRLSGDQGDDVYRGGPGFDRAEYYDQAAAAGRDIGPMHVNLRTGVATGDGTDLLSSIEAVTGSDKADVMIGDGKTNLFTWLFGGHDIVRAGGGDDFVESSTGANDLVGGPGRDMVLYLDGDDLDHQHTAVTVNLVVGTSSSGDTLTGFEDVVGSPENDTLIGDGDSNWLFGYLGDDVLNGRAGDDRLAGHKGSDQADGGAGIDRCRAEVRHNCESGSRSSQGPQ